MSFGTGTQQAAVPADEVDVQFSYKAGHEREAQILAVIKDAADDVARAVGGHVAVSVYGHINEYDDQPGDGVNIQVNSVLPPAQPVEDAGLEAAGGSPRNFPPEASTAAPATEDQSPPAAQEPVPQAALSEPQAEWDTAVEESLSDPTPPAESAGPTEPADVDEATSSAVDESAHEESATVTEPASDASLQDPADESTQAEPSPESIPDSDVPPERPLGVEVRVADSPAEVSEPSAVPEDHPPTDEQHAA
jgi:hypothetical protein